MSGCPTGNQASPAVRCSFGKQLILRSKLRKRDSSFVSKLAGAFALRKKKIHAMMRMRISIEEESKKNDKLEVNDEERRTEEEKEMNQELGNSIIWRRRSLCSWSPASLLGGPRRQMKQRHQSKKCRLLIKGAYDDEEEGPIMRPLQARQRLTKADEASRIAGCMSGLWSHANEAHSSVVGKESLILKQLQAHCHLRAVYPSSAMNLVSADRYQREELADPATGAAWNSTERKEVKEEPQRQFLIGASTSTAAAVPVAATASVDLGRQQLSQRASSSEFCSRASYCVPSDPHHHHSPSDPEQKLEGREEQQQTRQLQHFQQQQQQQYQSYTRLGRRRRFEQGLLQSGHLRASQNLAVKGGFTASPIRMTMEKEAVEEEKEAGKNKENGREGDEAEFASADVELEAGAHCLPVGAESSCSNGNGGSSSWSFKRARRQQQRIELLASELTGPNKMSVRLHCCLASSGQAPTTTTMATTTPTPTTSVSKPTLNLQPLSLGCKNKHQYEKRATSTLRPRQDLSAQNHSPRISYHASCSANNNKNVIRNSKRNDSDSNGDNSYTRHPLEMLRRGDVAKRERRRRSVRDIGAREHQFNINKIVYDTPIRRAKFGIDVLLLYPRERFPLLSGCLNGGGPVDSASMSSKEASRAVAATRKRVPEDRVSVVATVTVDQTTADQQQQHHRASSRTTIERISYRSKYKDDPANGLVRQRYHHQQHASGSSQTRHPTSLPLYSSSCNSFKNESIFNSSNDNSNRPTRISHQQLQQRIQLGALLTSGAISSCEHFGPLCSAAGGGTQARDKIALQPPSPVRCPRRTIRPTFKVGFQASTKTTSSASSSIQKAPELAFNRPGFLQTSPNWGVFLGCCVLLCHNNATEKPLVWLLDWFPPSTSGGLSDSKIRQWQPLALASGGCITLMILIVENGNVNSVGKDRRQFEAKKGRVTYTYNKPANCQTRATMTTTTTTAIIDPNDKSEPLHILLCAMLTLFLVISAASINIINNKQRQQQRETPTKAEAQEQQQATDSKQTTSEDKSPRQAKCELNSNDQSENISNDDDNNSDNKKRSAILRSLSKQTAHDCQEQQHRLHRQPQHLSLAKQRSSIKEATLATVRAEQKRRIEGYHEENVPRCPTLSNLKDESAQTSSLGASSGSAIFTSGATEGERVISGEDLTNWTWPRGFQTRTRMLISNDDALQQRPTPLPTTCDNNYNQHYLNHYSRNKPSLKWPQNNSTSKLGISMIDCNCIYNGESTVELGRPKATERETAEIKSEHSDKTSGGDDKSGARINAISNKGRLARSLEQRNWARKQLNSIAQAPRDGDYYVFGGRYPREQHCHRKDRLLRETSFRFNCWLLILSLTFSFLLKEGDATTLLNGAARGEQTREPSLALTRETTNIRSGKQELWLQLLGALLGPEIGLSKSGPASSMTATPALEHLAQRLAKWPSQERAALFYLDLLERRMANKQRMVGGSEEADWGACRRVSLAELVSSEIAVELIDMRVSPTVRVATANKESKGMLSTVESFGRGTFLDGRAESNVTSNAVSMGRMRAFAELNELIDENLLGKLNQEAKFADLAKLAVENANIISQLLIHPESRVMISIGSQRNFFKYLLESKVRQLVSSGSKAAQSQLLHSAGLIFFDAHNAIRAEPNLRARATFSGREEGGGVGVGGGPEESEESYNELADRHLSFPSSSSSSSSPVATKNQRRQDERGLAAAHVASAKASGPEDSGILSSLDGITQPEQEPSSQSSPEILPSPQSSTGNSESTTAAMMNKIGQKALMDQFERNKLKSSFAPEAMVNYGPGGNDGSDAASGDGDFTIKLNDLAKHPIASDANSHNGYFTPQNAFLSRWLVAHDELKLIELTERLNNLLNLPDAADSNGGTRGVSPDDKEATTETSREEESASSFTMKLADGRWFSPYFDCGLSNRWLLTYSLPFFASSKTRYSSSDASNENSNNNNTSDRDIHDKRSIKLRGVAFVSLDLAKSGLIDQCAERGSASFLSNTHQCSRLQQSRCIRLADFHEVRSGGYVCQCSDGGALVASERASVLAHREYLAELISGNSINSTLELDQLALPNLDDKLADKSHVAALLSQPKARKLNTPVNSIHFGSFDDHLNNNINSNRQTGDRNKLINAAPSGYFALGAELENYPVLAWFARARILTNESGLDKWPAQVCRLCKSESSANKQHQQQHRQDLLEHVLVAGDNPSSSFSSLEAVATCDEIAPPGLGLVATFVLIIQSLCAAVSACLIAILMRIRKSRIILASGWLMLETTLLGALLLYLSVLARCFEPTSFTCLLEPWLRELGFSIFYGSILIKLYRILTEFQTRKAHRVCFRDKDQIVYLLAIVLIVVGYMSAWTALMVDGFFFGQQQQRQLEQTSASKSSPSYPPQISDSISVAREAARRTSNQESSTRYLASRSQGSRIHFAAGPILLSASSITDSRLGGVGGMRSSRELLLNYSANDTAGDSKTIGGSPQPAQLGEAGALVAEQLPEQLKIFVKSLHSLADLFSGLLEARQQYDPTSDSLTYSMRCRKLTWDYVTELSEMGLLFFGIYLVYKLRNASSEVHKEKLVLCASIFVELFISALAYAIRHALWNELSSQQTLVLYCFRCHLTVTLTLSLIFVPKLWTIGKSRANFFASSKGTTGSSMRHRCHITCEIHDHHLNDAMRLHQAMLSNSALDIGSINLADMDPDEIQAELKRVYAQLEVLKTKVMRRDNPHISKRRGGRKQGHRKFSLQAFHAKHIASAVGGGHHSSSGSQSTGHIAVTDSAHTNDHKETANDLEIQSQKQQQQMIAAGSKKLPVLLEQDNNDDDNEIPDKCHEQAHRKLKSEHRVRVIANDPGRMHQHHNLGGQSVQRQLSGCGNSSQVGGRSSSPNQQQTVNGGAGKNRASESGSNLKKSMISADPVSSGSAGVYFDDDTLILNDSPSSENVSTQRQSSFVCSQSSIHPEESSTNY